MLFNLRSSSQRSGLGREGCEKGELIVRFDGVALNRTRETYWPRSFLLVVQRCLCDSSKEISAISKDVYGCLIQTYYYYSVAYKVNVGLITINLLKGFETILEWGFQYYD